MSTSPAFASTPRLSSSQVSAANTNRDGTGTIVTVFTAGASGSIVDEVKVNGVGTTTAGNVRLFIHDGVNTRLYHEIPVAANTVNTTNPAFSTTIPLGAQTDDGYLGLILPAGYSLRAATHIAEVFNIFASGGDF